LVSKGGISIMKAVTKRVQQIAIAAMLLSISSLAITSLAAKPAAENFTYSKLFDAPGCVIEKSPDGGGEPESETYTCPGPVSGVRTELLTGSDWDHLYILLDGQKYSLWGPMTQVGSWSGVGNAKGLAEWGFAPGKPRTRGNLRSFIVRFSGTLLSNGGETQKQRSQLAVFGLNKGRICWRGNVGDNAAARALAATSTCKSVIAPEQG
jgi:hypothetical protein